MTSNVAQSYPYTTRPRPSAAAIVARAIGQVRQASRTRSPPRAEPLPDQGPDEPGRPHRSWVFVCPKHVIGRLHVAGFARERHALFTVCDEGGETYLR